MFKVGDKIKWKYNVNPFKSKTMEEHELMYEMFNCLVNNNFFTVIQIKQNIIRLKEDFLHFYWHPEDFELIEKVPYSMGDEFIWRGIRYKLCSVSYTEMILISMEDGRRLAEYQKVKDFNKVTEEEFKRLTQGAKNIRRVKK